MGRKMKRWNGLIKGITAFIMAAVIAMSQIPGMDFVMIAYADNDKTITGLCTGTIGSPDEENGGGWSYVYYGKYGGNAMKYRVLDTAATQFGTEKTMLLDCDSSITNKSYHTAGDSVSWAGSNIKDWLNGSAFYGDYENTDVFTRQEQAAIASSTKGDAAAGDGGGWDLLNYAPLEGEHIFFLDAKEATRSSYGYANSEGDDTNRKKAGSAEWWLRSVAKQDVYGFGGHAGYVKAEGGISHDQGVRDYGVSPAFNLNLESVIFSSLIPNKTNEFKLTVKDNNMTIAKKDGSNVTRAGNVVTVPYKISGINDEAATQVSVLLTDEEYSAGLAATEGFSYLKLNVGSWDTSGTGTFTLPADYANKTCGEDYYAYILAETLNDGTATDYASVPASITIPDLPQVATPTFSPAAGTYTEAQNVSISCATEGATIYYTTDGSDPTSSSSVYSGPITVSKTTTIKAIAVKDKWTDSEIATATYTIEVPPTEYRTISFDPNANDASGKMDPQKIEKGKTEKLNENKYTREGYTFDCWNTKADGSGEKYADKASITPKGDMTLYAQWTEDKPAPFPPVEEEYTVTVTVSPEKTGTATASVSSGKTGTKVTLKAVSKAGYKFKKWKVVSGGVDLADATKTKTTFAIKDANVKVKAIFAKIYEAPQPEIEPVGDDGILLAWWKVDEAEGYDIFMSRCNHGGKEISPKLVKTIDGNETLQWKATGLKPNKSYKALIKAYVTDKNGKKKYISKSPLMHVYTAGGNRTYTNAKSIKLNTSDGKIKKGNKLTLKVKDIYKIKASVKKADKKKKLLPDSHVKTLRYRSSDPGVATVSSKGKITAKKKGKCKVYVYAHNGVNKTIKVTVK